jgi:hypothetical protein
MPPATGAEESLARIQVVGRATVMAEPETAQEPATRKVAAFPKQEA